MNDRILHRNTGKQGRCQVLVEVPTIDPPVWTDEVEAALHFAQHVVLSGNIRDLFLHGPRDAVGFGDLVGLLKDRLALRRIEAVLLFDPVAGLAITGPRAAEAKTVLEGLGFALADGTPPALQDLARLHEALVTALPMPAALVVDYATHLGGGPRGEIEQLFVRIDRQTRAARRAKGPQAARQPTFWLAEDASRLPDWFVFGNDLLRDIHVDLPDLEERFGFAARLSVTGELPLDPATAEGREALQLFALECDGETLRAMRSIAAVARAESVTPDRIADAIRIYRTGIRRNPWASGVLADRVRQASALLGRRIKGQDAALDKTMDILARSIIGLSGAQSGARHLRPRGVLFLAGPTGVGKTELAKAITELLFGDETACHRFDMSEFMQEASIFRLLGAPPGHPGHERGGELVNAAHRRPFSVFLFDEVEKAHPRILDVFLQILDEGRLTDSRGFTAHFSEALIVFTSNIGVTSKSAVSNMGMNALPSDSHDELESKIRRSIEEHFRNELQRPELLNRIGQNIVVFDFLSGEAAHLIFEAIVARVLRAVKAERGITVEIDDAVLARLRDLCTQDFFEGGRGIGNRIERNLINPLSRSIFEDDIRTDCLVSDIRVSPAGTRLTVLPKGAA